MAYVPVLEQLTVTDYTLFPGTDRRPGLRQEFKPGLTLVLGANGLGKTTLVSLLYRLCAGPFDVPGIKGGESLGGRALEAKNASRAERKTFAADGKACVTLSSDGLLLIMSRRPLRERKSAAPDR